MDSQKQFCIESEILYFEFDLLIFFAHFKNVDLKNVGKKTIFSQK